MQIFHRIKNMALFRRRAAYNNVFSTPEGRLVLADLRRFCRATLPTADIKSVNTTYLLEGRREVWLRIQTFLNLSDQELYQLIESTDEVNLNE